MKVCRFTAGNGDTFSHTPSAVGNLALFPSTIEYMESLSKECEIGKIGHISEKNKCTSPKSSSSTQELVPLHCADTQSMSETLWYVIAARWYLLPCHCHPVVNSVLTDKRRSDLQIPYVFMNFIYLSSLWDAVGLNGTLGFQLSVYSQHWKPSCPAVHV